MTSLSNSSEILKTFLPNRIDIPIFIDSSLFSGLTYQQNLYMQGIAGNSYNSSRDHPSSCSKDRKHVQDLSRPWHQYLKLLQFVL